jgi:lipid-binding SYLF domain-containing protein
MTRLSRFVIALIGGALSLGAVASELEIRVDTATEVLQDFRRLPENAVPPALLGRAYAVAVIPSVVKAGFVVGGTHGRGIVVARRADGQWSNPFFVQLTQGSIGFQAGVQSTDLVLVFKSQRALDGLSRGKITLGGDASIAAGPVGRQLTAATDLQMQAEIYSYARSRGFFAGISLQGGALTIDRKANGEYYGEPSAARIMADDSIAARPSARRFVDTLTAMAPAQPTAYGSRAATRDPDMEVAPPEGARTFGIDDGTAEGAF